MAINVRIQKILSLTTLNLNIHIFIWITQPCSKNNENCNVLRKNYLKYLLDLSSTRSLGDLGLVSSLATLSQKHHKYNN